MSKTSNAGCRQGGSPQVPAKDSQPVLSAKPEQALLEQIQHLLQQLAESQRDKGELAQVKRLHQINQDLNKQVSTARGSEISHRKGRENLINFFDPADWQMAINALLLELFSGKTPSVPAQVPHNENDFQNFLPHFRNHLRT